MLEAATGLGMTDGQRLRLVELPLALPVILAGVRIAAVVSVGTATIAAAIGAGGLGTYVFRGIATVDTRLILAGAIPAAILALVVDALLGRGREEPAAGPGRGLAARGGGGHRGRPGASPARARRGPWSWARRTSRSRCCSGEILAAHLESRASRSTAG